MPPQRPHSRLPSRLPGALALWLLLLVTGGLLVATPAQAGTSARSSKSSASKKKKNGKKATAKPRSSTPKVLPVSRDADGPLGLTTSGELEDEEGEEEEDGEGDTTGDPEAELEAIERELLANPVDPEPMPVEIPSPVSDPRPIDSKPQTVKHEVIPGERFDEVVQRYGADPKKLKLMNNLRGDDPKLTAGKDLRVQAVNPPPPRERLEHIIKKGETWDSVARELGLEAQQLRTWNRALAKASKTTLVAKKKLVFWRDPPPPSAQAASGLASKLAQIRVRAGGISIGRPSRGRLVRGVELPDRPDLYTRRKPDESWGSSHAITQLMAAVTRFRHETGFKRGVVIGGISRARGGRFRPHKSHQSGRDIDIRMPITVAAEGKKHTTASDVDWKVTWKLIHAFLGSGEVEYIFLDHQLQKRLYKAAREAGATKDQLSEWLQWPNTPKSTKGKKAVIRHQKGHVVHFHVRIRCAEHEKFCVTAR
ncbi:MAG: penicillin-insensitive murein endopeptidase [Nannocystis sp.]|nr:penicillin-insensitive murein endopeptidase [Nannocystis sp.]MBA3549935.1 penicillin-insensitive murein endopeptidase [Nannocystis sp.]